MTTLKDEKGEYTFITKELIGEITSIFLEKKPDEFSLARELGALYITAYDEDFAKLNQADCKEIFGMEQSVRDFGDWVYTLGKGILEVIQKILKGTGKAKGSPPEIITAILEIFGLVIPGGNFTKQLVKMIARYIENLGLLS